MDHASQLFGSRRNGNSPWVLYEKSPSEGQAIPMTAPQERL